jgi:hypothetical protein
VAKVRAKDAANANLETAEGRLAGANLAVTPQDIMLVSPPKCGTTWLCQIVHMLRARGDMSFEEINLVGRTGMTTNTGLASAVWVEPCMCRAA